MTRFIALLAIVSGLILAESKADVSEEWCTQDKNGAIEQIAVFLSRSLPVESLNEYQTQAYLTAARNFLDIPPMLGVTIIVAQLPGTGARGYIFKGDKYCARLTLPWNEHEFSMKKARGASI